MIRPVVASDTEVEAPTVEMDERLCGGSLLAVITLKCLTLGNRFHELRARLCIEVQKEASFTHLEGGSVLESVRVRCVILETVSATVVLDLLIRLLDVEPTRFAGVVDTSIDAHPLHHFVRRTTGVTHAGTPWGSSLGRIDATPKSERCLCHFGKTNSVCVEQIRFWESACGRIVYPQFDSRKRIQGGTW